MSYDVHVVRSADWLQAASDPISRADVDTVVAADSELAWSETDAVEMADETGTVTRYFMITWRGAPCFWWYQNQVVCSNPAPPQLVKLVHIARALHARVIGDDGERYDVKRTLLGKEKLITIAPDA